MDTWAPDDDVDWLQQWNEGAEEQQWDIVSEGEEDWDKGIFLAEEKKKEEEDKAKKEKAKKDQEKARDKEEDWDKQILAEEGMKKAKIDEEEKNNA